MIIWAIGSSVLMGTLALLFRSPYLALLSIPISAFAFITAARQAVRVTRDWLCPPVLFLVVWTVRFAVPLPLVALGADQDVPLFRLMGLTWEDWVFGYVLTELALLGFLLPWGFHRSLRPLPEPNRDLFRLPRTLDAAGVIAGGIGLVALALFVGSNVSGLGQAIVTGAFRTTTVQEGTGFYFFLSLLLFSGTALLTCRLLFDRKLNALVACAPCLAASAAFWILGGRVRASIPIAVALVLVTYRRRTNPDRPRTSRPMSTVLRVVALVLFTAWLFGAGDLYRGGAASIGEAPLTALRSVADLDRWRYTLVTDFGQLHAAAGATRLDGGGLNGKTYTANALWPASQIFGIEGKSVGTYIVEENYRLAVGDWGFHSGAATDAHLNFGLWSVALVSAAFGWVIRQVYWRFRLGEVSGVIYALGLVYAVRMFFEGIEKWPETLVALSFLWVLIRLKHPAPATTAEPASTTPAPALEGAVAH